MSVHGCINQLMNDSEEDDEGPITFKRPNSSSKQSHSSSASKKTEPRKHDRSSLASSQVARNGVNSRLQNDRVLSTLKESSGKPSVASLNARSSVPAQSKHASDCKSTTNGIKPQHKDEPSPEVQNSDDSEDDKPLIHRLNSASGAVQKNSMESEKHKHSSDQKFENKSRGRTNLVKPIIKGDDSDDEDHKPLSSKFLSSTTVSKGGFSHIMKESQSAKSTSSSQLKVNSNIKEDSDDSEDEKPLLARYQSKAIGSSSMKKSNSDEKFSSNLKLNGSSKEEANSEMRFPKGGQKRPLGNVNPTDSSSSKKVKVSGTPPFAKAKHEVTVKKEIKEDVNDHIPIAQRMKKSVSSNSTSTAKNVIKKTTSFKKDDKKIKKKVKDSKFLKSMKVPPGSGGGQKWTTLEHNGVIFPPPYKPHGVKMLYNGQPVDLSPEQEEVATMFAVMKDTEYATKKQFIENFMNDWRKKLGKNHVIKKFELCDFTPIYEWHLREKEKKKQMSAEEKKALKEEKLKQEEKYMWAIVDGVKEKVGNFRVEPPGLFRGRGEHPKMGKLKKRIRPRDITINVGKGAPVPECPIPGERWKDVKHDNTVTWLAFWNDPINPKEFKYVFLAASSSLKGQSDKEKYEKARLLKDYIQNIRSNYTRDFTSKDPTKRQIAVATYLIDKLALRAGNEKDDDEADTVGCCTLKVENVELVPPNKLKFDFLGKDSIRYLNTVEVEVPVYKAIGDFQTAKKSDGGRKTAGDDLFDLLDTSKLNAHLKELMPGLTAKVFRTYNASITLDVILNKETKDGTVPEKIAVYQHANKEVAIICNHQRSVSKSHESQMSRLNEKINDLKAQRDELKVDLSRAKKGKPPRKDKEGKTKKNLSPEVIEKKLAQVDAKIEKMELDKKMKEDLKTVALGTSKINYLDPRISVAWCKRHEVPIEKIFNKSLLAKFAWAMDVDPYFRF